jgi:hypothetical protein
MNFDSNLAWKQASSAVSANREVLLALAGVFFMVPQLALAVFYPQPQTTTGMSEQEVMDVFAAYYGSILPMVIPMVLLQAVGTLALLSLLDGRRRPTVGEAIKGSLRGVLPYLLAQILTGFVLGLAAVVLVGGFTAAGGTAGTVVGLAAILVLAIYVGVRVSLTAAAIAVEHVSNPLVALSRSWRLTKGNTGRLLAFYGLFIVAFIVVLIIANVLVGIPLALLAPDKVAMTVEAVLGSALSALMALYFVAIIAASHRQLAGATPESDSAPFA